MPDVQRLVRETVGSRYYRGHPREAGRYTLTKWRFARHTTTPDRLLTRLGFDALSARRGLDGWSKDLNEMLAAVAEASAESEFDQASVSDASALVLYGLVRSLAPDVVIETGVAAGVSSSFIGAALAECGRGTLISIDLPPQRIVLDDGARFDWRERGPGWAMPARLRAELGERHRLVLEDVRTALPRILGEVGEIDCFVHDDLHTPDHMRWEFELVWPYLRPGGVVVSDDLNHGWLDFATARGLERQALANVDRLAAVRKPAS